MAIMWMSVGVVMAVRAITLLVHGAVVMVMVMVVSTILSPAAIPLALLGWQVT